MELTSALGMEQWRDASKSWTIHALVPTPYPQGTSSCVSSGFADGDENGLITMLASEPVLRREWDSPEEDAAWADL